MISRYALYDTAELSNRFKLEGLPKGVKPHYNISPTIDAPVIIKEDGKRVVKLMKWGLVAQGAKDTNSIFRYKTYNLASEKILSKHSWQKLVRESRCLIPANGFYELNGSGKKRAFYATPTNKEMFAFAGVHSTWQDPEGNVHGMFSVITIQATDGMYDPNGRMPIIIKRGDETRWLDSTIDDTTSIYDMLRQYPSELLDVKEVSPAVHSPKPNKPDLIDSI